MDDTVRLLRRVIAQGNRLGRATDLIFSPWLLLTTRVWLSQVVFVHRIMMMVAAGAGHALPFALEAVIHGVAPLLLATGLLTRPVAATLLAEAVLIPQGSGAATWPKALLLAWLLVSGPGPLSIDHLVGRGLAWVPFPPVRGLRWLYAWTGRTLGPLLRLVVRVGLAGSIVASTLPLVVWLQGTMLGGPALARPGWIASILALALLIGLATRLAALVVAGAIPLAGLAMSMDDRLSVLLLLLLLAASGAGVLSADRLLVRLASRRAKDRAPPDDQRPHVVVVGGGFGGVAAVQGLRRAACRITLIDQRNHHLFQPLLYQVATAALSPADIATPIRSLFRGQDNVRVHLGEVTGLDPTSRHVLLGPTRMTFDFLILATGARHSYFGRDDWAAHAPGLKTIEDATAIRSRLLRAFEEAENAMVEAERAAWLTFVIVGGGPTGIELAGAIAELAQHGMEHEYRSIDPTMARVILLQSGPRILPSFPANLSNAAERSLKALRVDVRTGARVRGVDADGVDVGDQRIHANTILWAAGVAASPAAQWLGRTADAAGRLAVGPDLSVPELELIFAIGDTAACLGWRGMAVPGLAPAAKQQGHYVARVIARSIRAQPPPPPFRYRHFGSLATIGRQAAVAELGRLHLWGAPAWWFWGAAHVAFLVGGRNRAIVLLSWVWAYLTYRRSTRLITGVAGPVIPRSPALHPLS